MSKAAIIILAILMTFGLCSCAVFHSSEPAPGDSGSAERETESDEMYNTETTINEVIKDPVFGDYGRLIFPVGSGYMSGSTLTASSMIFIRTKKRKLIRRRRIPACSSSEGIPAGGLPSAMPAAGSPMWGPCTTVSLTRWSCRRWDTTPSR